MSCIRCKSLKIGRNSVARFSKSLLYILDDDTTLYLNWNPVSNEHELVKLLQDYNSSPISIYASSADYLFVKYNSKVKTDGLQLVDVQPLYALIEKEDYLQSVANYKIIDSFLVM